MNLLILHLSDMHFGKKNNFTQDNISAIVNALHESMRGIDHVLVIVSRKIGVRHQRPQAW